MEASESRVSQSESSDPGERRESSTSGVVGVQPGEEGVEVTLEH